MDISNSISIERGTIPIYGQQELRTRKQSGCKTPGGNSDNMWGLMPPGKTPKGKEAIPKNLSNGRVEVSRIYCNYLWKILRFKIYTFILCKIYILNFSPRLTWHSTKAEIDKFSKDDFQSNTSLSNLSSVRCGRQGTLARDAPLPDIPKPPPFSLAFIFSHLARNSDQHENSSKVHQ